jgi:cyclase
MLRPRIIPCLLVHNGGLVKTVGFKDPKYVGDPINAVKIFNEKEADELIVVDIDATANDAEPNYRLIAQFAAECRMPLCYGGGVRHVDQARRIISLGVEKVAISAAAHADPDLVGSVANAVGSQSVVVVLDVRRKGADWEVVTHNGKRGTGRMVAAVARSAEQSGAGEVVLNSIDADGRMKGYDLELAKCVRAAVRLPMTVLGGAGSLADIGKLIGACGVVGAAAGSFFVFKGAYRAVLISYPDSAQKEELFRALPADA